MTFPLFDLVKPVIHIIDKIIPDPAQREAAKLEFLRLQQAGEFKLIDIQAESDKNQSEINKVEAASNDKFTSRWRPFCGWICGIALAYHYIAQPLLAFILVAAGHQITLPVFDMDSLYTLLMGLLGLGGMRSFDKLKK